MPPSSVLALTSMTAGDCVPCGLTADAAVPMADVSPGPATSARWSGVIGVEGEATGDGRLIEMNALVWDALPIPLRYVRQDVGEHSGAVVVGMIDTISRGAGGSILSAGSFDLSVPEGTQAMEDVKSKRMDGVSMDLDDVSFEVRVRSELVDQANDAMLAMLMGDDPGAGFPAPGADGRVAVATIKSDDELMVTTSARIRAATLVSIPAFNTARIALVTDPAATAPDDAPTGTLPDGSTGCSCDPNDEARYDPDCVCAEAPAAPTANAGSPIPPKKGAPAAATPDGMMPDGKTPCSTDENDPAYNPDCAAQKPAAAPTKKGAPPFPPKGKAAAAAAAELLVASAAPDAPPAAWFSRPALREATALTVTAEGQVYGHLAAWNTCHISHAHAGCVTPPHSAAGYAYFHTGAVLTAEGAEVSVGHVTLDTRHAGERMTAAAAASHYENTGHVVADVSAGEDQYGIWVAGALRPSATETQVRALRSAPLSGDWRRIRGNLELVAALAVNVPGFPVPRPKGLVASGVAQSLVASGMIPPRTVRRPGTAGALSIDDLKYLKRLADRERAEESRAALEPLPAAVALARRVRASSLAMRAHRQPITKET